MEILKHPITVSSLNEKFASSESVEKASNEEKKLIDQLHYHGFTKAEWESFQKNGFYFKTYDFTPELREKHDRELSDWREKRDREIRLKKEPVWSRDNLTLREKWEELLDTYELGRHQHLDNTLWKQGEKPEPTGNKYNRNFIKRLDGNIGVKLKQERIKITDEYLACRSLLNLTDEQVQNFKKQNLEFLRALYKDVNGFV